MLQEGVLDGLGAAFRVLAHVEVNKLCGLALILAACEQKGGVSEWLV